jgi:hypothetical protein
MYKMSLAADQLITIALLAGLVLAGINPVQNAMEGKRERKRPSYSITIQGAMVFSPRDKVHRLCLIDNSPGSQGPEITSGGRSLQ